MPPRQTRNLSFAPELEAFLSEGPDPCDGGKALRPVLARPRGRAIPGMEKGARPAASRLAATWHDTAG